MNVTLDDILKSYETNIKDFNYNSINDYYKDNYTVLKNYYLIHPQKLDELELGNIIRYSKTKDKVSAAGIIVMIEYKNNCIDYFVLRSLPFHKTWRIYPNSYYIFQYDKNNSKKFYNVIKNYIDKDTMKINIKKNVPEKYESIDDLIEKNKKYFDQNKVDKKLKKMLPGLFD
jgi:hypothetical protein